MSIAGLARRRLLGAIPLLLLISFVSFSLSELIPGDVVLARLGEDATAEQYAALRQELGLDRPFLARYVAWLGDAVRGDLGKSLVNSQDVANAVVSRLPVTLSLTFVAVLIAVALGVPAGLFAGARPGGPRDRSVMLVSTLGLALPNFWIALLLVAGVSLRLRWFPATGYTGWTESPWGWIRSVAVPSFALGLPAAAIVARQMRSALIGVLQQEYIRTALAKGASRRRVVIRHALKNALVPVVTVLGFQVTALIGGALVVEKVLALPGLGSLAVTAVHSGDIPVVQGIIVYTAMVILLVNLVIDVLYGLLNPKVRVA